MRLIFTSYFEEAKFAVSEDSKLSKEQNEHVIQEFSKEYGEQLEKYITLRDQQHKINQEMKETLAKLKEDFKEFVPENFPELVL